MKLAGFKSPAGSRGYPSRAGDESPYIVSALVGQELSRNRGVAAHAPNGEYLSVHAFKTPADARAWATEISEEGFNSTSAEGDRVTIEPGSVSVETIELVEGCFE